MERYERIGLAAAIILFILGCTTITLLVIFDDSPECLKSHVTVGSQYDPTTKRVGPVIGTTCDKYAKK